jgi:hypothetical protein
MIAFKNPNCASVFSECNFGGTKVEVCLGAEITVSGTIKSVQII